MINRITPGILVGAVVTLAVTACSPVTTSYVTKTTIQANKVTNLWRDARYRYVAFALMSSASATAGSEESKSLGRVAMDGLVKKANLRANRALVDMTVEEGDVLKNGKLIRVVTLRGDVVEFLEPASREAGGTKQ